MTTHRRYYFQHPGEWTGGGHDKVLSLLRRSCERHWWYNDPTVVGATFNLLQFEFTVSARDQWFAHKRAMSLAVDVYYCLGMDERSVPTPMWEALAPHTNRGRYRVPQ